MKKKIKSYLKLNLMSLFFIAVSFISVTLAWFAYSGISRVAMEVDVKAWYIELEKDGEKVSRDIVISLSEIYPGMDTVYESVKIKNLGDSNANVKYKIVSARILGEEEQIDEIEDTVTSDQMEDSLSHEFPFGININLSKSYILAQGDESLFEVSISWPLDSDNDLLDSQWGTKAYDFQNEEKNKKNSDENYQVRPSIQIVISIIAEQYLETNISSDPKYNLGDEILYDVVNNRSCESLGSTCIKTYVIDTNNKLAEDTVTLLANPFNSYLSGIHNNYDDLLSNITNTWTVNTRALLVSDLLKVISTDVQDSLLIRTNLSDSIIGNLESTDRMDSEITKTVNYNGYYKFLHERFAFLSSTECYWVQNEFNSTKGFALRKLDDDSSIIYGNEKDASCKVVPVILANKSNL